MSDQSYEDFIGTRRDRDSGTPSDFVAQTDGVYGNLEEEFNDALQRLINASAGRITLGQGYRSPEEQEVLYEAKLAEIRGANPGWSEGQIRQETGRWVAPPGQSNHGRGLAADLNFGVKGSELRASNVQWAHDNAGRFGLHFPLDNEDWHVQLDTQGVGNGGTTYDGASSGIAGFNPEDDPYSYLYSFLDHPEIGQILYQAADLGWDAIKLEARLKNTEWWRTTQDSARKFEQLLISDPETARQRVEDKTRLIQDAADRMGIDVAKIIGEVSVIATRLDWTEDEIVEAITTKGEWDKGGPGGELGTSASSIQQLAKRFLVVITQEQASRLAASILNGSASLDSIQGNFALRAQAKFSGNKSLSDFIGNGGSPEDFFADHKTKISQMIGVDESAIDLINDPTYSKILSYEGGDGTVRPMTVHEATRLARKDDRFKTSATGRGEAARFARAFGQSMGKASY